MNAIPLRKKKEIKYLVLDDIDENKEVLKNMKKFGRVFKKKLEPLIMAKKLNMEKISKKLGLSLMLVNKPIKLRLLTILIRSVLVNMVNFNLNYFYMMRFMNYKNATISKN